MVIVSRWHPIGKAMGESREMWAFGEDVEMLSFEL